MALTCHEPKRLRKRLYIIRINYMCTNYSITCASIKFNYNVCYVGRKTHIDGRQSNY